MYWRKYFQWHHQFSHCEYLLDNFGVSTGTIVVWLFENDYYVSNIYFFFCYHFDSNVSIQSTMSWPPWWDIDDLHCSSDRGSGYQSFFCCWMNLKIVTHSRTLNWNIGIKMVKKTCKYLTHNNHFQTAVRL